MPVATVAAGGNADVEFTLEEPGFEERDLKGLFCDDNADCKDEASDASEVEAVATPADGETLASSAPEVGLQPHPMAQW